MLYYQHKNQINDIIINLNHLKGDFEDMNVDKAPLECAIDAIKNYIDFQTKRESDLTEGFFQWWTGATGQDVSALDPTKISMIRGILTSA